MYYRYSSWLLPNELHRDFFTVDLGGRRKRRREASCYPHHVEENHFFGELRMTRMVAAAK
jgi:hypothetical protein